MCLLSASVIQNCVYVCGPYTLGHKSYAQCKLMANALGGGGYGGVGWAPILGSTGDVLGMSTLRMYSSFCAARQSAEPRHLLCPNNPNTSSSLQSALVLYSLHCVINSFLETVSLLRFASYHAFVFLTVS